MESRYFGIKELSEYTSVPESTLYDWARIGKIPSIKIGRKVLFDKKEVDHFLEGLKRKKNPNHIPNKSVGKSLGM